MKNSTQSRFFFRAAVLFACSSLALGGSLKAELTTSLPYSNQWLFEESRSSLFLAANKAQLSSGQLPVKAFSSDFDGKDFWYPSVDYFAPLFRLASLESESFLRDFSIRSRYGLGFLVLSGHLSNSQVPIQSSVETSSLLGLLVRLGPQLSYERWKFFTPFIGEEVTLSGYRHSATLNGAEAEGICTQLSTTLGIQLKLLEKFLLLTEARYDFKLQDSDGFFGGGFNYAAGLGIVF